MCRHTLRCERIGRSGGWLSLSHAGSGRFDTPSSYGREITHIAGLWVCPLASAQVYRHFNVLTFGKGVHQGSAALCKLDHYRLRIHLVGEYHHFSFRKCRRYLLQGGYFFNSSYQFHRNFVLFMFKSILNPIRGNSDTGLYKYRYFFLPGVIFLSTSGQIVRAPVPVLTGICNRP